MAAGVQGQPAQALPGRQPWLQRPVGKAVGREQRGPLDLVPGPEDRPCHKRELPYSHP